MSIEVAGLQIRYGKRVAVAGLGFTAAPGEVTAILGPNGCGKSSLLKALAGLVPFEGHVRLADRHGDAATIGYMPQDTMGQAALTVTEVVLLGRLRKLGLRTTAEDLAQVRAAIMRLGIPHLADRHLGELSGGQRQTVFLTQVIASDPSILLLDEPISALDIRHQLEVLATIRRLTREQQLTTLVVLHDLNAALRFADRVLLMLDGQLIGEGEPERVLTPDAIRQTFGVDCLIEPMSDGRPVVVPIGTARDARVVHRLPADSAP